MSLFQGLGPNAAFIITAYAVATVVVLAMIAWVVLDHRALKRSLALLERSGMTRRSERPIERTE